MIYMFNVNKDDCYCTVILDNLNIYNVKILELIEYDNINLWIQNVRKLHQNYNIRHHYYMGSDDYLTILKLVCPELKRLIYRKEWEDLSIDKLIKKITNNLIELPLEWENLKAGIFTDDIKIDSLKLIASINCFWVDDIPEDNGIFSYYDRKKETTVKRWEYSDINLQEVLRHFD